MAVLVDIDFLFAATDDQSLSSVDIGLIAWIRSLTKYFAVRPTIQRMYLFLRSIWIKRDLANKICVEMEMFCREK